MKRTLAVVAALSIALTGCTSKDITGDPIELPTVAESPSVKPSEVPTRIPEASPEVSKVPTVEPKPTEKASPDPQVTSEAATTPAIQFASRWGKKYPAVPEYAILKAANGVCDVTMQYPAWSSSPVARTMVQAVVVEFGLDSSDAIEFTADAQQNYCASVSNPV